MDNKLFVILSLFFAVSFGLVQATSRGSDYWHCVSNCVHGLCSFRFPFYYECVCDIGYTGQQCSEQRLPEKPNIIMILADDMGYGDLSSYGHPTQEYGPIDEMAKEGLQFKQAYSADSVCTPSRGALLTGRLPVRVGLWGDHHRVFFPWVTGGLPREEITIAEALKERGYTTGMVGKWHLGINRNQSNDWYHLPWHHGFDFVGHFVPWSSSIKCDTSDRFHEFPDTRTCAYMNNDTIVSQPYHLENLNFDFVEDAKKFIANNHDRPFFFYFPMMHPHVPLSTSELFKGSSKRGPYGDTINEISWAVGQIRDTVREFNIHEKTLIIFMSDHGPHLEFCSESGDPGIFRGSKGNSFEGGYRVPLIAYWPGVIAPLVSNEIYSSLDLFPSFLHLAGGELSKDRTYDGVNSYDVLLGRRQSQRNFILFYNNDVLFAVRYGDYKIHFFTQRDRPASYFGNECQDGLVSGFYFDCNEKVGDCVSQHDPPLIFDIVKDPTEAWSLNPYNHQEMLAEVNELVRVHRDGLQIAPSLLDTDDFSVVPCCNRETNCVCNFEL